MRQFFDDIKIYNKLLQKRIHKILLVCSSYDFFMLEQDGRIDTHIFKEYIALNLKHPPFFIQVDSSKKAFKILKNDDIDLVIVMPSLNDMDLFEFAKKIKVKYKFIPVVVLSPVSRELNIKITKQDNSNIDYIFTWLGDSNLLLAIIKLVEDKINAPNDIPLGTQAILLVEDSKRYYSSYLTMLYKLILEQTKFIGEDSLNENQMMLRKRGRPKVLLARSYEEAINYFNDYYDNIIGVISDFRFPDNKKSKNPSGYTLLKYIKSKKPYIPLILQSSDPKNKKYAKELKVGFFDKNEPDLLLKLKSFLRRYLGFGPFIFIDPTTKNEIFRAKNYKDIQKVIYKISDDSLKYHLERNHLSRWLNTRALFSIGNFLKSYTIENFENLDDIRHFIDNKIRDYRSDETRGIISEFNDETYDEYINFARIGQGMLGGKARGIAFLDKLITDEHFIKLENVNISIPRTVALTNNIFDEFMTQNDLYDFALNKEYTDDEILKKFIEAEFPQKYIKHLRKFIETSNKHLAVRSSSLLEDSTFQPFAGVYSTYMIPNLNSTDKTLELLLKAIKAVYASVYYKNSKAYMEATDHIIEEERMGIVIQEICGEQHNDRFYPIISGVARSINLYPVANEKPEDGIVNIAFGLGKQIVEGETSLRFSPKNANKILQLTDVKTTLRLTQKHFYALKLDHSNLDIKVDDSFTLQKFSLRHAQKDGTLTYIASTYDIATGNLYDGAHYEGLKVITFNNILKHKMFPFAEIISKVLEIGKKAMNNDVEIEFAVNFNFKKSKTVEFKLLQIRPIPIEKENFHINIEKINQQETILISELALGNDIVKDVYDIIYVKTKNYSSTNNPKIAEIIGKKNEEFHKQQKNYFLIGPGRWGSHDKWLGIPVVWSQISKARIIVEAGLDNYRIEPSQGTHFFHNLTSFNVGYFTVNPYINDGFYDVDFLDSQKAVYEDEFIRHIHFDKPIIAVIDGKERRGIIFKPGFHPFAKDEDFEIE